MAAVVVAMTTIIIIITTTGGIAGVMGIMMGLGEGIIIARA